MWLLTSLLILWPCFGLTMEGPTPYSLLYSDVDACTRYNFLPINTKNFREAILFFNLCQQLIHLLPENQRKDYAKHLKHEVIMTKNEFKSRNNNKDIAKWLDARIDSLIQELNKLQPDTREKQDFKLESFWPILPLGKVNAFRKNDHAEDSTIRYTSRTITVQADDLLGIDHPSSHQDYNFDQEDDSLMAEEKVNINDIALIGLILGLVSTVSAAMTLLYICYCGAKRARKKGNHQKGGMDDDKEKLINQRNSRAATDAQVSTKIAKYASGECKLNRSDGRISEYQSFDGNCPVQKDGEHSCENTYREESSMVSGQQGMNTYETETDYEQANENLQWDSHNPEASPIYLPSQAVNLPNMQAVNNQTDIQGTGYPRNGLKFSQSTINDQSHYYAVPTNELGQRTKNKDGYGDSEGTKLIFNNFSQQKLNEHNRSRSILADMRELQKCGFLKDDKTNPSFSYIQQKYSKGQAPLINTHFPCDMQQTQPQQKNPHLQQQRPPLLQSMPHQQQEQQLSQLQDPKMTINSENTKAAVMNSGEKEPSLIYVSDTLRVGDGQEPSQLSQCKNCKKRISAKKRQGLKGENISTLMRMKMEASKNDSGVDKTSAPHCNRTDSESIMQEEKFLCSMSATTPLTTKEQCFALGDKTLQNKSEISEQITDAGNNTAKNKSHLAISEPSSNVQKPLMDKNLIASSDLHLTSVDMQKITQQKQYYMSLHAPAVKKYHRQKCVHPKSPLATPRSAKKLTRKLPMQEINSSYYSVKPGSPYQSCAEVNPILTSKQDPNAVSTSENMFTQNIQQKDFQKALRTMFNKYSSSVKGVNDDQEMILRT